MKFSDRVEALAKEPDFVADAEFVGTLPDEPSVEALERVVVVFRRMADRFERVLQDHKKESTTP